MIESLSNNYIYINKYFPREEKPHRHVLLFSPISQVYLLLLAFQVIEESALLMRLKIYNNFNT